MTHEIDQPIKRRADGSIDTRFYMMQGHQARSQQAHDLVENSATTPSKILTKVWSVLTKPARQRLFKYASSAKY